MLIVYIPCTDKKEAREISERLLMDRLAGCVNIFSANTMYREDGGLAETTESVIIAKTNEDLFGEIERKVKRWHSYELPAIIKISAETTEEYAEWLTSVIG